MTDCWKEENLDTWTYYYFGCSYEIDGGVPIHPSNSIHVIFPLLNSTILCQISLLIDWESFLCGMFDKMNIAGNIEWITLHYKTLWTGKINVVIYEYVYWNSFKSEDNIRSDVMVLIWWHNDTYW